MKLAKKMAVSIILTRLKLLSIVSPKKAAAKALHLFCTPQIKNKKPLPAIFKKGERIVFKHEGLPLILYRWNKGAAKKILIIHGFESSCKNFDQYVSAFFKKNYEVIAFDAPAHGESEGSTITMPQFAAVIQQVVHTFGPMERFMAHSFGGLALMHHLQQTSTVASSTKLVLIAPATSTKTAINMFFSFTGLNKEVRKLFDTLIYEKSGFHPEELTIEKSIEKVNASILWIHDKNDEITPIADTLPIQAKGLANIEFKITEGLGHRRIYRDQEVLQWVVDFL